MERVGDEIDAEPLALAVGVHGQALEVALGAGPSGDGVPDDAGITNDPQPRRRGGVDRLVQPVAIEAPERLERLMIDLEDRVDVALLAATKAARTVGSVGEWPLQVVAQQVERFVFGEAVGGEHVAFRRSDRRGDDLLEAVGPESIADPFEGGGGEGGGRRERDQVREVVAATPAPGSDPSRVDGQRVHPHAECNDTPSRGRGTLRGVLLLLSDERCLDHTAGTGHPERPDRLRAAIEGIEVSGVADAIDAATPRKATDDEIVRVHDTAMLEHVKAVHGNGGGRLDPDTVMSAGSLPAARLAAGSVLTAVERLEESSDHEAAFCVVRPPGHHATPSDSMGFCLFNSVAIAAMTLADAGERVAIVDIDAHHGNGTQDVFYDDPRVLFASIHQSPLYPGSGMLGERGRGEGAGATINVPLPPGATGDVARAAVDDVIVPAIEAHGASWLFISAGFDGHRADPITDLGYSSADMADLVGTLASTVPSGRVVTVLEGGYDLGAMRDSSAAVAARLVGVDTRPETPTSGGPGIEIVRAAADLRREG